MVDSLKTFNEGEYIYASETNSNNQYLLSKLSDNAAQVQTYVEGEISSIQSNVASVQATLQGNIDAVSAVTKAMKSYVTKTYVSGTSGYLVFSDGLKIQWGRATGLSNSGEKTITLLQAFSNSNYIVVGGDNVYQYAGDKSAKWRATTLTKTSFKLGWEFERTDGNHSVYWLVLGY